MDALSITPTVPEWYVFADGRSVMRVHGTRWSLRDVNGRHVMYI